MLSWVREKLAEGRLRWQQSVVQQSQRNSPPSPPPLPPPSAIDDSPTSTVPETDNRHHHHSFDFISSDDSLDTVHSPTAVPPNMVQRSNNGAHRNYQQLQRQDNQIDNIKTATTSTLKRYSHISRISQR